MPIVYIIFSESTNKFYVGSSHEDDISARLNSHNRGAVRSTKNGRPWVAINLENFSNYTDARKKELFLKSGAGRNWVKEKFGHYKKMV